MSWAFRRFITATCCCNTTDSLWRPAALPGFDPASNLGRPSPRLSANSEKARRNLTAKLRRKPAAASWWSMWPVSFWYPPGEVDVRIVRESPEGPRELSDEERREVLTELWDITLAKVDATML